MRILIIEDNKDLAANIVDFLSAKGHIVDSAVDGAMGLRLATTENFDALVLDLMLPKLDGLSLCKHLRTEANQDTPVLILTSRDTISDKLAGFESGADDYLIKPFSLLELEARLTALTCRGPRHRTHRLQVGDLCLNLDTWEARREGKSLPLTPTALRLLEVLLRASPRLVRRNELESSIWGDNPPDSEALRTHIHTLRSAIDKPFSKAMLQTVPTMGYRLIAPKDS